MPSNNLSITTLEELGWIPYWDEEGRYPIKETDTIKIEPASTIRIYLRNNPVQAADGNWYGNKITMYEPLPSLIAGVYKKEDIFTDSFIGGGEDYPSLIGKIEEFAFWEKDIGGASILNYQTNMTSMVGTEVGSMYGSVSEAEANGLRYYYNFSEAKVLTSNFNSAGTQALKSSVFNISSGKHSNASVVPVDGHIKMEKMNFKEEFTLSTRIYMEKMDDFLLFENRSAINIRFDGTNKVFIVSVTPYIGQKTVFNIEVPYLKVHLWYDIGISLGSGKMSFYLNGESIEDFALKYTIGGASKLSLSHENIESTNISVGSGTGIVNVGTYNYPSYRSWDGDSETDHIISRISNGTYIETLEGGDNISNLLVDKDNPESIVGMSMATDITRKSYTEVDPIAKKGEIEIYGKATNEHPNDAGGFSTKIKELSNGISEISIVRKQISGASLCVYPHYKYDKNFSSLSDMPTTLHPLSYAYFEIKTKGSIVAQEDVFPKILIFPTTRIKVEKIKLSPPAYSKIDIDTALKGNMRRGTYNDDFDFYSLHTHPYILLKLKRGGIDHFVGNKSKNIVYVPHTDYILRCSSPRSSYSGMSRIVDEPFILSKLSKMQFFNK